MRLQAGCIMIIAVIGCSGDNQHLVRAYDAGSDQDVQQDVSVPNYNATPPYPSEDDAGYNDPGNNGGPDFGNGTGCASPPCSSPKMQ
jgi:hypothetical protein